MPVFLLAALPTLLSACQTAMVVGGGAVVLANAWDGVEEWFTTDAAWEIMTNQVNTRLSAAGIDLVFPTFNPFTDEGQAVVKSTIEKYALDRINAKTGAEFTSLADLNQDTFLEGVGQLLAKRVNRDTGANLTSVWPVEHLKEQLRVEVVRQFDNRGRYAGGALFKGNTLARIREKVAAKHPALMAQVKAVQSGGMWGPAKNEAERKRREAGLVRQQRYRQTHQQVWSKKPGVE